MKTLIFTTLVTLRLKNLVIVKIFTSINPLYFIINSATGYFKEKDGGKYLILDSTEKYEEAFSGIISEIKTFNGGKEIFYEKIIQESESIQMIFTLKQAIKISNTNNNY